jgi:hypothetical protein
MDTQTLINILIGACGALIGWVLKSIRESIRDLQNMHKDLTDADNALADKVQKIEVLVAGTYVKRDDLDKLSVALFNKLDKIEAKLDGKADK